MSFPGRNSGLKRKSRSLSVPPSCFHLTRVLLCSASLILLAGDINPNPGPVNVSFNGFSSSSSTSSEVDTDLHDSFSSSIPLTDSDRDCDIGSVFNLHLGDKGLRFGSWNVNGLSLSKFEQIKLYMLSKNNRPQIDILSINETTPGFDLLRRDRKGEKKKGGVLIFINHDLKYKRRSDLEDSDIEEIWLEAFPYKSKRPLLFAGIYRPPNYSK